MDIHDLVDELGIWWPKADRGRLRQAIAAYRQMAADCGAVRDRCAATVGHVHASNSGPPFQAFDEYWARWQGGSQSYLDAIPQFCSEMADALERYLEAVEDAIHKLEELAVIALTAIGVGIALTVFTAGLSDAAAAGATAALVSAAGVEAGTMAAVICEIAATAFVTAAFGFVDGLVIDTAVQVERIEVFGDQKSWSWGELWQSGRMGLGGGVAGGLSRSLTVFGGLRGVLAGSRAARMAFGAGVGTSSAAIVDATYTGRVDPLDLLIGGVGGAGGAGAGRAPAGAASERQNSISNLGEGFGPQNARTLTDFPPGSAFSGVYDPASRTFSAYPSVPDPGAPGSPANAVYMYGGHSDINDQLGAAHGVDTSRTVAFTTFLEPDGSISVGWRSRGVNGYNHGDIEAPPQFRQQIMDAIAAATGKRVWSRT